MVAAQPQRKPVPDPYEAMEDDEVLAIAAAALQYAGKLIPGSEMRKVQWGIFESAMSEMARRAMAHIMWKIYERELGA